jgi:CRP-like cAMP-binding protein
MGLICENCRKNSPVFRYLSHTQAEEMYSESCHVNFSRGEIIEKQGTKVTSLGSVLSGTVKIYRENQGSGELILDFIRPYDLLLDPGIFLTNTYQYSMRALEDTRICLVEFEKFKTGLSINPLLSNEFTRYLSQRNSVTIRRLAGLSLDNMYVRIANALMYLTKTIFHSDSIDGRISRQDLADFTAMTKDSAIRVLKRMEREGKLILEGKSVRVIKPSLLD